MDSSSLATSDEGHAAAIPRQDNSHVHNGQCLKIHTRDTGRCLDHQSLVRNGRVSSACVVQAMEQQVPQVQQTSLQLSGSQDSPVMLLRAELHQALQLLPLAGTPLPQLQVRSSSARAPQCIVLCFTSRLASQIR